MQRAGATTPASSGAQTPATEPLAKRRRIESAASSPSVSVPGTPVGGVTNSGLLIPARGGISTFTRFEGADTEWVLDMKMKIPKDSQSDLSRKSDRVNGSASRFSALAERNGEHDEVSAEEDDIWNTSQPSGRQTFGTFKRKRKSRVTAYHQAQEDDEDLSSASASGDTSDSDADCNSDPSSNSYTARHRRTPTSQRNGHSMARKEVDSDEEMRQARRAIEQKHRSMMGGAGAMPRNNSTSTLPITGGSDNRQFRGNRSSEKEKGGKKRKRRDEGSYKKKKKARKTI